MKKLIVAAVAVAVALVGFASIGLPTASANPSKVWFINLGVAGALNGSPVACTPAGVDAVAASLDTFEGAGADQVNSDAAASGGLGYCLVVQTDGSTSAVTVTNRGLDGASLTVTGPTAGTNGTFATAPVATPGTFTSGNTVSVVQDSVSLDSKAISVVSAAHDVALVASKPTVQEGATACATAASQSSPSNGLATVTFTDINGNDLVGYAPTFKTSAVATLAIGNSGGVITGAPATTGTLLSVMNADGKIAAEDSYCGVAAGSATLTASSTQISGQNGAAVNRTADITVTGVPAAITLASNPTAISCNGTATSTVTATVKDSAGNNVVDGTAVTFSVVALGTANPINTTTKDGVASSVVTPLSGNNAGTVVNVSAGSAAASIRIDCLPSLATATAAAAATATPVGGIVGPNTGTGGYLGQDSGSSFPMWALAALALGSLVLVGGGIAARRAGK